MASSPTSLVTIFGGIFPGLKPFIFKFLEILFIASSLYSSRSLLSTLDQVLSRNHSYFLFYISIVLLNKVGDRRDSNPRPPGPQPGALTKLSYDHHGALDRTRTYNLQIRSLLLYPFELREPLERVKGIEPS